MSEQSPDIAIYLRLLYGGGAERVMVNLMKEFVRSNLAVDLVMNTVSGPYLQEVPAEVRIIDLNTSRMLSGLPKLVQYLKENQPKALLSALHYTNEIAITAKFLANCKTKLIVSEQNTLSIHSRNRKTDRWAPILTRCLYPFSDQVIVPSHGVANDLIKMTSLSHEKITVIYNPVIAPDMSDKANLSPDHLWFGDDETIPIILGIGRLEPQKDFPTLIKAFAKILKKMQARLVILGNGKARQDLLDLASQLGIEESVSLPGFVKNPHAFIARANVFVLSSAWEGFGNVVVEAMCHDIPVVSTNCPYGPAEILDDGRFGKLVSVGDSSAMAKAILAQLHTPIKSKDNNWLKKFTLGKVSQEYIQTLVC